MGFMIVIGAAVILGGLVNTVWKAIPEWVGMIFFLALLGWIYSRLFIDRGKVETVAVTVGDLFEAATVGKWVKHYGG